MQMQDEDVLSLPSSGTFFGEAGGVCRYLKQQRVYGEICRKLTLCRNCGAWKEQEGGVYLDRVLLLLL